MPEKAKIIFREDIAPFLEVASNVGPGLGRQYTLLRSRFEGKPLLPASKPEAGRLLMAATHYLGETEGRTITPDNRNHIVTSYRLAGRFFTKVVDSKQSPEMEAIAKILAAYSEQQANLHSGGGGGRITRQVMGRSRREVSGH